MSRSTSSTYGQELTKEDILQKESEIDLDYLKRSFVYKGKKIKTYGDLRKLAKTTDILESIEYEMDDDDYAYMYQCLQMRWFLKCFK